MKWIYQIKYLLFWKTVDKETFDNDENHWKRQICKEKEYVAIHHPSK